MCHFIRNYYDLRGCWSTKEKKRNEIVACLKEVEAGQKIAKASLKHDWAKQDLAKGGALLEGGS